MSHINTSFESRKRILKEIVCSECGKQGQEICDDCFNKTERAFYRKLVSKQQPISSDIAQIISDDFWEMSEF